MRNVIERVLNLLAFLLTAGRPVTADEIRSTVAGYDQGSDEAFRRTFERDKDLLRGLGIPLERHPMDAWEVEFGYVVPDEQYALQDPGLTDEERVALLLAAQAVRIGGQVAGPDAILKLGGAPLVSGGEPLAADLGLSTDVLGAAFSAVADRRELRFRYAGRLRAVQPYGLIYRRGHWYVAGPERDQPDPVKAFRLDRAENLAAEGATGTFRPPEGFRVVDAIPDAPWEAGDADVVATVRFDPEVAWLARRSLSGRSEAVERKDGTLEARIPVATPEAFLGWLITFDDKAELIEPVELRDRLVARVRGET
jgi:predicted DNA-binding transcriptional regulator YafY